ncbi:MAG: NmrA family NAD(P)-binding protein [Salinivirgaceae bacterium]
MRSILITGATGNIGIEVIRFLYQTNTNHRIVAGVRNPDKAKILFKDYPKLEYVRFDFENSSSFAPALKGIERVFLLRPPNLSAVDKHFKPFIETIKQKRINELVFLSVQGAEKSKVIPHNKIERLVIESGLDYIFLRPSYFMQNLTTTLLNDIKTKRAIILPSGKAKFNWIDINNIAETGAIVLNNFETYKNQALELTGMENESFDKVTALINKAIKNPISYQSVNPLRFYMIKKQEGMAKGMILVMLLLHYLPRFQKEPALTPVYEELCGKKPTSLRAFIEREKEHF